MTRIMYTVTSSSIKEIASLVDRGANGGIPGQYVRITATTDNTVDIQCIDNHQVIILIEGKFVAGRAASISTVLFIVGARRL
jgi:hypothetical protein